jgi:hypothetical protein
MMNCRIGSRLVCRGHYAAREGSGVVEHMVMVQKAELIALTVPFRMYFRVLCTNYFESNHVGVTFVTPEGSG